jgi:hypothetical protein
MYMRYKYASLTTYRMGAPVARQLEHSIVKFTFEISSLKIWSLTRVTSPPIGKTSEFRLGSLFCFFLSSLVSYT